MPTESPSSPAPGLLVATDLDHFEVPDPGHYAPDLQIEDRVYRQLDPAFYAWLRRRMVLAKNARERGKLSPAGFATLRERFNRVHGWAIAHLGEHALLEAVRTFDPKACRGPTPPEPEDLVTWGLGSTGRPTPADSGFRFPVKGTWPFTEPVSPEAVARVDAIREDAVAKGWSLSRLYQNRGRFAFPLGQDYGLVCFLGDGTTIAEVRREHVLLRNANSRESRFFSPDVEHPWCRRVQSPSDQSASPAPHAVPG